MISLNSTAARLTFALLVPAGVAAASGPPTFHLRPGIYVQADGGSCRSAAFADLVSWDAHGFGGAHATQCVTRQTGASRAPYRIATTCSALGDGTPAAPSTIRSTLWVHSAEDFSMGGAGNRSESHARRFHWGCSLDALSSH